MEERERELMSADGEEQKEIVDCATSHLVHQCNFCSSNRPSPFSFSHHTLHLHTHTSLASTNSSSSFSSPIPRA